MKIILKKTGEEILMNTILHLAFLTPRGVVKQDVEVCMDTLPILQQMGIISVIVDELSPIMTKVIDPIEQLKKDIAPIEPVNTDPNFYLDSFDETPMTENMQQGGMEFLVLMHIAVLMDQRYSRNIKDSRTIYWCNPTNGRVEKLDKIKVKNFNRFPAFRTREDAIAALIILSKIRKIVAQNAE